MEYNLTNAEIFEHLIDSPNLSITLEFPPFVTKSEIEGIKRSISSYKNNNKDKYEDMLGNTRLRFVVNVTSNEDEQTVYQLQISIEENHSQVRVYNSVKIIEDKSNGD